MSAIQYLTSSNPTSVIAATHIPYVPPNAPESYVKNVDRRVEATLAMPSDITATLMVDHRLPPIYGFIPQLPKVGVTVEGELGSVSMYNYVLPTWYHSITVKIKGSATRVEKVYKSTAGKLMGKDGNSWTTYRYQLEAFVDKIRGGEPAVWMSKEESVSVMQGIEMVYEKVRKSSSNRELSMIGVATDWTRVKTEKQIRCTVIDASGSDASRRASRHFGVKFELFNHTSSSLLLTV